MMKTIIIFISTLLNIQCYAGNIVVIPDTTMSGTYNGGNKILRIEGKISGTVTIINAIIEANPFIQIFDTTVTIGSNVKISEFSGYWFGGKPTLSNNSTQLQRAINTCINRYKLYIPYGAWNIQVPLLVGVWNGVSYDQAKLVMYGDATFWENGSGTQILYTGSNRFAINFQLNKGSEIHHLRFTGGWVSPGGSSMSYFNLSFANYLNQGAGGNCAGIAIDNYGTGTSGSTGCSFHDLFIEKFEKLIEISNNTLNNGDIMIFQNIQFGDAKVGLTTSQAQEKCNVFRGIYSWGQIHTMFSIGNSGKHSAGNYFIEDVNIAGSCIRLFWLTVGGWFPTHINNFYAEHFATIGNISSNAGLPIHISNSIFDFALPSEIGVQTQLTSDFSTVKFDNCVFRFYGENSTLNMSAASFDNCYFNNTVTGFANIYQKYYAGAITTTANQVLAVNNIDTIKTSPVIIRVRLSSKSLDP